MLNWTYDGVENEFTVVIRDKLNMLVPATIEKIWVNLPDTFSSTFDEIEIPLKVMLQRSFKSKFVLDKRDDATYQLIANGADVVQMKESVTGQGLAKHVWACCSQLLEPKIIKNHNLTTFRLNLKTGVRFHKTDYEYLATADEARGLVSRSMVQSRVPLGFELDLQADDPLANLMDQVRQHYRLEEGMSPTGKTNERKLVLVPNRELVQVGSIGWVLLTGIPDRPVMRFKSIDMLRDEVDRMRHAACRTASLQIQADVIVTQD